MAEHNLRALTWEQVTAFRLSRHSLLERAQVENLGPVVADMTGAQAQLLSAAQISLWARMRDLKIADIDRALNERSLVKAACMRRTLFLVPGEQLAIFSRGSARRAEKEVRWTRGKGVSDRDIDAAIEAALGVLDRPLTRPEIAAAVSRALGVETRAIHGGGWGSRRKVAAVPVGHLVFPVVDLLHLAASRGVLCYGPQRDGEPTFVRADAWIPGWQDVSVEQAETALLRRYLRAYGPATPADFALWAGITLTEAREIWAREKIELAPVSVDGWKAEILSGDLDALAQASIEPPVVRLLPYFDTFLLGHKQRDHLIPKEHQPEVFRPQGWISPVVLVNGRAAAVWKLDRTGKRSQVTITPFGPLPPPVLKAINAEANDLARFLGAAEAEVVVS